MAPKSIERAHLPGRARGVPIFGMNPITGLHLVPKAGATDSLVDGEPLVVLDRDYRTAITTLIRSTDGGRTWQWCQVHEILQTRKQ